MCDSGIVCVAELGVVWLEEIVILGMCMRGVPSLEGFQIGKVGWGISVACFSS